MSPLDHRPPEPMPDPAPEAGQGPDAGQGPEAPHGPEGARLAEVIAARREGRDPHAEAARRRAAAQGRAAHEAWRRTRWRLRLLAVAFALAYAAVGGRMAVIAASDPQEPRGLAASETFSALRAEIVDRRGELLAANLPVWSVYARPHEMVDPEGAARALAGIFPDLDADRLLASFRDGRRFVWVKPSISPAERIAVHDIGEPGLLFGPREMRVYPAGREAAHVLGGAGFGQQGVRAAEIIGTAGVELRLDERLRDPARAHEPVRLSIDLRVQRAMADVLREGVARLNAKGAAGILMDARNGEIIAMVSLPDFDPNNRPPPPTSGHPEDHPNFNRAAQGLYELGSTFKTVTAAMMLEHGLVTPETMVDSSAPLVWGRFRIRDFSRLPNRMSVHDVVVKSSNTASARMALQAGTPRFRAFLERLGMFEPMPVELPEAGRSRPKTPDRWGEISTITISYGHGMSVTPLHLATGYASLMNGGLRVRPTLIAGAIPPTEADRVVSARTSAQINAMMRAVVTSGTGRAAEVPGYFVGGKTGTADKPGPTGGYDRSKTISTFVGGFPAHDPRYVILIAYDEGVDSSGPKPVRTAGRVAAPSVAQVVSRVGPLLGMWPEPPAPPMSPAPGALLVQTPGPGVVPAQVAGR